MVLYKVYDSILVAHPAPTHAPNKLPDKSVTKICQYSRIWLYEMIFARNGKAVVTTIKLNALLRIMASSAPKPNKPINSGSLNSAPPKLISPPQSTDGCP